jgi:chromosome segregation ATPase
MKEGSFEGLMSGLDFNSNLSQKTNARGSTATPATPDQMPAPLNLSNVPEPILRSNVMESLISQNDDLMARLNVALRRISLLEEKYKDAKTESAQVRAQHENLRDQVLILKEQAQALAARNREIIEKQRRNGEDEDGLKEKIRLLEIRYAELYSVSRERQSKIEVELSRAEKSNSRLRKYRANIRKAIVFLKEEVRSLRGKRTTQDAVISDLRKNLQETTAYITEQNRENKAAVLQLTNSYEDQLRNMRGEISQLIEQNTSLAARGASLDKVQNDKVRLENDLIIAERRFQDLEIQSTAEITEAQKALGRYRNESKELALELNKKAEIVQQQSDELTQLRTERNAMGEQVETLQLLWRDQQNQVDKLVEQKSALQKLNQELSISINEYRREVRELKEQIEASQNRLTQHQKQQEIREQALKATDSTNQLLKSDKTPDLMAKIDQALNHLHFGK